VTHFAAPLGCLAGSLARFLASWTHLYHQPTATEVNVGQRQGSERTCCVLLQAPIANLAKSPEPLDHAKDVFYPSANLGLVAVLAALYFVNDAIKSKSLFEYFDASSECTKSVKCSNFFTSASYA